MFVPALRGTVALLALVALAACQDSSGPGGNNNGNVDLSVGGVQAPLTGTSAVVPGGDAGADYTIVAHSGSEVFSSVLSVTFTGQGVGAAPAPRILLPSSMVAARLPAWPDAGSLARRSIPFEVALRNRERQSLRRYFDDARAWNLARSQGTKGVSFAAIPSNLQVGDNVSLNVSLGSCTDPVDMRTGRVAAITQKAIVISDNQNPSGGFTDGEYASIGTTFDTLVAPVDEAAFGAPADMDNNAKVVLFFTRAVNELTPRGSTDGVVGGFFYARDLFPKVASGGLQGCPSSNEGEMFYLLVADPLGEVSDARTKAYVTRQTIATVSHEYQHLINASRRIYVNTTATDFEETWLNEGLSHVAEELLFFRVAGLSPRQNISSTQLTAGARFNAFIEYQMFNLDRFRIFLENKSTSSAWADNDDLGTRGATWNLLRYLADHRGNSGDSDTWLRLVNATTEGWTNLGNVFGADVKDMARDWATSLHTDDLSGFAGAPFQEPSWNIRQIFGALRYTDGSPYPTPFPLSSAPLTEGAPQTVTLNGGGMALVRFSVPAGTNATISWSASGGTLPPSFQVSIARTR